LPWRDPVAVFAPFADEPHAVILLSAGRGEDARWSYIGRRPAQVVRLAAAGGGGDFRHVRAMLGPRAGGDGAAPFEGGVVGLIAYEFGVATEGLPLARDPDWPDLHLAEYRAVLAFDHAAARLLAIGRGADAESAAREAEQAGAWLAASPRARPPGRGPLAAEFRAEGSAADYEAAVAAVKDRIAAGEIFQANIARSWTGSLSPGATPLDVLARLREASPAPFCAAWRLPGLALVSHSPERFIRLAADGRTVETMPIKGTRPRGATPALDAELSAALIASVKDRAEHLMIVDLMRNDLSRVCAAGSVRVPDLQRLESFEAVHHLVSTITGRLADGRDAADLLAATFPPGSITGAPKHQAMRVIAAHEPPRGPWCGVLFWAGYDGALDSSVLIRTAAFVRTAERWRFRASAGAGVVADSDPVSERLETEAKISGLARAFTASRP
jgi:para-aminobenzoate synthetase component 1